MSEATLSQAVYRNVFLILTLLLTLTVGAAFLPMGGGPALAVAGAIAMTKALLVVLYFMHVRVGSRLVQVFIIVSILWLLLLVGLTMNDYMTRTWDVHGTTWPPIPVQLEDTPSSPTQEPERTTGAH